MRASQVTVSTLGASLATENQLQLATSYFSQDTEWFFKNTSVKSCKSYTEAHTEENSDLQ